MAGLTRPEAWTVTPRAPAAVLASLDVGSPLLAQLLLNRGVRSSSDAALFLDDGALQDPFAMADMPEALARVTAAIEDGRQIVVYGDYDVDGLSGATLLALALEAVGAQVEVFIPHRERDGYGLNAAVLERLAASSTGLVISVDCGVSAEAEIAAARDAGLDVVVTDHHHVPPTLPRAVAVLNPHRPDCPYPFKQLAGAGVALKLAQAVAGRFLGPAQREVVEPRLLELATLGTIADVMPLSGENRAIVQRGLRTMNRDPSPGLRALCRAVNLAPGWISAEAVAFKLAPRLNAAGRVGEALLAHRLLAARSDDVARGLALELETHNSRRRALTDEALHRARADVAALGPSAPAGLVVDGEYPLGVVGLVATRLAEETGRPTAVIGVGKELCRGSVRGVPGFDTVGAVVACRELLLAFGGHRAAAGLSLAPANLGAFRARFAAAVEDGLVGVLAREPVAADCRLRPDSIDSSLCELLARLEPCGDGNPPPLFETGGLLVREARVVGERHLRLALDGGGARLRGILFDGADSGPVSGQGVDLLHRVRRNVWRDTVSVELEVVAWRPSRG